MARRKFTMGSVFVLVALAIISLTTIYPVLFMFLSSLRTRIEYVQSPIGVPTGIFLKNYINMFISFRVLLHLKNSLLVNLAAMILTTGLGSLSAYAFAKSPFRGSRSLFLGVIAMMMVPAQVLLIPTYQIFSKLNLINHFVSLILMYTVLGLPYTIFLLKASFTAVPDEVLQAAKIDGASYLRVFTDIMLPMGKTAILTVTLLNFIWCWNELLLGLMYLSKEEMKTMSAAVATIVGRFTTNIPYLMTGLFLNLVPVIILYLIFQEHLVQGLTMGAIK